VQLRNPLHSTNYFSLATTDVFTNKYNANTNVNLCAQCHNSRGAAWTETARAPHRSPQYNYLLGSVGELLDGSAGFNPGSHAGLPGSAQFSLSGTFYLTNQCVACHMQDDAAPAGIASHTFEVASYDVCMNCHVTDPGALIGNFLVPLVSNNVATVIYQLNRWAALKAPTALRTNGAVLWEYTSPGGLAWQTNSAGFVTGWQLLDEAAFSGPDAGGQALIPDRIKKARFDLYLVLNDGSYGVHNFTFTLNLLYSAQNMIAQEMSP
jgi:hypothetical protein